MTNTVFLPTSLSLVERLEIVVSIINYQSNNYERIVQSYLK